jgi:hypothetical protein
MSVGGQLYAPAALPERLTRYPLYRRLGGPKGLSGRVRKISPPPGFDPRTVHSVASRYTDYAIDFAYVNFVSHIQPQNFVPLKVLSSWVTKVFLYWR